MTDLRPDQPLRLDEADDAPITLREAAETFFRGNITADSLKAQQRRGKLATIFIEGREYTTRAELVKMCEQNATKVKLNRSGVYVVGYGTKVKIGVTVDFKSRLRGLRTSIPEELIVHAFLSGKDVKHERKLHTRFRPYHIRGEWFRLEGELAAWIKRGCRK